MNILRYRDLKPEATARKMFNYNEWGCLTNLLVKFRNKPEKQKKIMRWLTF